MTAQIKPIFIPNRTFTFYYCLLQSNIFNDMQFFTSPIILIWIIWFQDKKYKSIQLHMRHKKHIFHAPIYMFNVRGFNEPKTLPLCVCSSTLPKQSWAGWPALALRWTVQGHWSVGHGGAGRSERSRGSRLGGSAWRIGRLFDWARSNPSSWPLGKCSLSDSRRSLLCPASCTTSRGPVLPCQIWT